MKYSLKILAIDTSLETCSAALLINNKIYEQYETAPRQQAQLILPMIDDLLSNKKLKLSQLDTLAFGSGPGSFTGVRIAASVIQGLAAGTDLPVVPISTLQAMAQGANREFNAKQVLVCVDARMQEIYWGMYHLTNNNLMEAIIPDTLCSPDNIPIPTNSRWFGIGNGWLTYGETLKKMCGNKLKQIKANFSPHAKDIALLAKEQFLQGLSVKADQALPVYLRGAGAWKKLSVSENR
jgi:tRNA threonylcarbamoyladenosine biosynthesis protein TsaB